MTGNIAHLSDFKDFDGGYVTFGGGAYGGRITGKGTIKTDNLDFDDVYFVKELKFNLFSVSQMCDKKNYVLFTDSECLVLSPNFKLPDENQILLKIPRQDNMYSFDMKNIVPKDSLTCLVAKATSEESMLWHRRLGHINFKNINKLVKENLVRDLPLKRFENDQTCVACLKGKQHRASCKTKAFNPITKPLFMLHMDLFGPTFVSSLMHKKYCLVVTDDYSRFSWVFFLTTKDETSEILKIFIKEVENLVDKKVKIIRSDNGTEFKNKVMDDFCREKAFLEKSIGSEGFHQVIDFLSHSHISYALTKKPDIYISFIKQFWRTAEASTDTDGEVTITAIIDGQSKTITEASLRRHLKLEDHDGITSIPNSEIFAQLALMGYQPDSDKLTFQKGVFSPQWRFLIHTLLHCLSPKKTAWEQFSSNIATALICLATNRKYNFSRLIFEHMVTNIGSPHKFLMYPRFIQICLDMQKKQLKTHSKTYHVPSLNNKVFSNMRRLTKGYTGVEIELFPTMLTSPPPEPSPTPSSSPSRITSSPSLSSEPFTAPTFEPQPSPDAEYHVPTPNFLLGSILTKLEANAELSKDVLGQDLHEQDFAKRMVDMVNQRKKLFNQGTWKLSQLRKLKFEEIKEEFDTLVQQIDTFVPINLEATKAKLKRYREEL
ncbi:putative ribonuclease H-like domain-containing protein [Tanacetum coccineum]|uniref:Ribonuclease H-like domain-containing protein n=1 Tax=Tanacetum coccineum TaxID=301880 RepID=A0ABQ5HVD0_9ASTR